MHLLAEADPIPWNKLADLGVSAAILLVLLFLTIKFVIPKYMQQQQDLLDSMMKGWKDEAEKARIMTERLMLSIKEGAEAERKSSREALQLIIDEWKETRRQIHLDAQSLAGNLKDIASYSSRINNRDSRGRSMTGEEFHEP